MRYKIVIEKSPNGKRTDLCRARVNEIGLRAYVSACTDACTVNRRWWITRAIVIQKRQRGKGVGGRMLERVIKEIRKMGGKEICVQPGGYANNRPEQVNFYKKHGFKWMAKGIYKIEL